MKYEDFVTLGSENAVKAEGKYVQKGKEYVVEDGDIILFRFNVSKKWFVFHLNAKFFFLILSVPIYIYLLRLLNWQ